MDEAAVYEIKLVMTGQILGYEVKRGGEGLGMFGSKEQAQSFADRCNGLVAR